MTTRNPEDHERKLVGIVERAATNGRGLGVAMPAGIIGGRFGQRAAGQQPDPAASMESAAEAAAEAVALDGLVHKIASTLAGANMDHAITALVSLATHYATSETTPIELRAAAMHRFAMGMAAIDKTIPPPG